MPRWFTWTLLALVSWGIWAILGKQLGNSLSPEMSQALSTLGVLPVAAALLVYRDPNHGGDWRKGVALALAAGICSSLGNVPYYGLLAGGSKAAVVVPLVSLSPLVTVALAVALLRERLSRVQMAGIVLAMTAIYLFNVPQEHGMLSLWLAAAMLPIVIWGFAGFFQKLSTNHVSGTCSAFWFLVAFFPVAAGLLFTQRRPITIDAPTWITVLALGFTLALGNFAIVAAFASGGKASVISPLAGLYPLVSIPLAVLVLGERLWPREALGAALALAAVSMLAVEAKAPATATEKPGMETAA